VKPVNKAIVTLFFSLVFSFNLWGACLETRGAFDVGSGSLKLVVATVDTCSKTVLSELYANSRPTGAIDYLASNDQTFKQDFKDKLKDAINDLKASASPFYVHKWFGVATEAYRKAKNGETFISELSKEAGIPIQLIPQEKEAELAIAAIHSAMPQLKNNKNLVVWDIGGGSQQIIAPKQLYLGKLASANFKQLVMQHQNKTGLSPNPLGRMDAIRARHLARAKAEDEATQTMKEAIARADHKVYGIGGVHTGSLYGQLKLTENHNYYDQKMLLRSLLLRADLTDRQIGGRYADTDITNLALVLGFMEAFDIREVIAVPVSLSHGVLLLELK
jgi:exopolyphosphatase/guanosine-5'-triphosphate,3'-diphosphate pyrophosphatase